MMRSLWTAASGMVAQQTNLDTISNNLSNINTTGYKTEAVNFKSLIYQTLQQKSYDSKGEPKPVSAQVGLGVRPAAIVSSFTQGALLESVEPLIMRSRAKDFSWFAKMTVRSDIQEMVIST